MLRFGEAQVFYDAPIAWPIVLVIEFAHDAIVHGSSHLHLNLLSHCVHRTYGAVDAALFPWFEVCRSTLIGYTSQRSCVLLPGVVRR